jgi:hypothetical protein
MTASHPNSPDGGPLFPTLLHRGVTLRDAYAAVALHGILTGPYEHLSAIAKAADSPSEAFAAVSNEIADAMLKARAGSQP